MFYHDYCASDFDKRVANPFSDIRPEAKHVEFKSLFRIVAELKTKQTHALKMDVEGSGWAVFSHMLSNTKRASKFDVPAANFVRTAF